MDSNSITVVVPTYRRTADLEKCLISLNGQIREPDEIVVVCRENDLTTIDFLERKSLNDLKLRYIKVSEAGAIASMSAGVELASGNIVALIDDDAYAWPDWLLRIEKYFSLDATIGGVGGRYWDHYEGIVDDGNESVVGKIQYSGRVIGNHYRGFGNPREVDILNGISAYRKSILDEVGFDNRLKGSGAQVHWEIALSLRIKSKGWKLIYDPSISVNHYRGKRYDEDQRSPLNSIAISNATHNETLVLLEYMNPFRRLVFIVWFLSVGTIAAPGVIQALRLLPRYRLDTFKYLIASLRGRMWGVKSWMTSVKKSA